MNNLGGRPLRELVDESLPDGWSGWSDILSAGGPGWSVEWNQPVEDREIDPSTGEVLREYRGNPYGILRYNGREIMRVSAPWRFREEFLRSLSTLTFSE